MKRIMKWTGAFLLLCAVAFAGLIIVLPMVLDPNDYKDKISRIVYEQSGFQLEIPGDITLNISPRLEVLFSLGQVQVLSAPGFPDVPLLRSEDARVEFSLMPLLKEKRLVIQGILLHGVYSHLIRDTSGKGNWEITATATESQAPAGKNTGSEATPTSREPAKTKATPTLELDAINLSRVTICYEDQKTAKVFELKPFRAKLYEGTISAELSLDVRGKVPQLEIKNDITQVQIGPPLSDMTGKEEITGTAVVSLQIKTKGNSKEQLTRNANGSTNLALEDGVIKKLHILQIIRQTKAIYQKKDIVLAAAKYVDYLLKISVARGMDRNEKSGKTDYSKVIIPYRIQGEFSNLKEEADVVAKTVG